LIFNRKMEIIFSKEDEAVLDGQSKICNWLYNHLLEMVKKEDYKNGNKNEYLTGSSSKMERNLSFFKNRSFLATEKYGITIKRRLLQSV
jgi:hypothetical protein